ncbi:GNAT family protein [Aeromicrobium sp. IC_218]|uniref:GNAT family N-acetyltransferase n=1 Tax=Aeromicrobium sp. IC_218 TaxID=2545468 RepID=UPI00103C7DE1|nr:GNAT family protein [Aeromicrobium sp. IC_218]TCJ00860.1 N-acetyltransferase [Aeromicrobium sp. IC_218]
MTTSPWPRRVGDLLLRDAVEADLERLLVLRNDPVANRYTVRTHVPADDLRREWLGAPDSATDFSCVVESGGAVVAMGMLDVVDGGGQPGAPTGTDAVIGYLVDPAHAGRGIATGLARELLAVSFDQLGVRRVTAICFTENPASARVLEKAGMRREGHRVQDCWRADGGWSDSYLYALLRSEWRPAP